MDMKRRMNLYVGVLVLLVGVCGSCTSSMKKATTSDIDWEAFLAQHDMHWNKLTADPDEPKRDFGQSTGYYAGAIMGNGLLGTNLYKLRDNVYRMNVGRSDVTEVRQPYGTFNSARLPIGYFTIAPKGTVSEEEMRLSLYDAETAGHFATEAGRMDFRTYVHATRNVIVFESECVGEGMGYNWDFVPQEAISPRCIINNDYPLGYVNSQHHSNPAPERIDEGDLHFVVQPLALDTTFASIGKYYVVAWNQTCKGTLQRVLATVAQQVDREAALNEARQLLKDELEVKESKRTVAHRDWWHKFYNQAAFLTFPDMKYESFYWAQYYKFASTARPGCPIVDLMGVWPNYDTPWPAIWMNLNIQLTYCWQTKANLGWLAQPLWDGLYAHRDNLGKNVTDIAGQEDWTDAACLPRTCTYDFHAPLNPALADRNQYEVGNLAWTLHYYWLQCNAYGDKKQMRERLFPLLKSAVNIFFHIRQQNADGKYVLPPTASPEYTGECAGPNTNYDLANLRQGLATLLRIDAECGINDPMRGQWQDFLDNLVDFPYSEQTGFKVSDTLEFLNTSHRHYSHLFMIYPYYMLSWDNPADRAKMELSIDRWQGDQGYSRTGKAAMLAAAGRGNDALDQMEVFMGRFLMPNTLYAESGPVIETPLAAMSSLHELYLQDWGDCIRVFHGVPLRWTNASFVNMRAQGAFLVSATREAGATVFVQVESEQGNVCKLQTDIPVERVKVASSCVEEKVFSVVGMNVISFETVPGEVVQLTDAASPCVYPHPLAHPESEAMPFGDGSRQPR